MVVNEFEIKKELTNFFRNADVFSTTERGVTTITDSFSGDGSTNVFTLTHTNVKNVRWVKLGDTYLNYGVDYEINFEGELCAGTAGSIYMREVPQTGETLYVCYDYGNSDKIFPDFPREDLSLSSFPRFGFDIISITSEPSSIGANSTTSNILIEFIIYANDKKTVERYARAFESCLYYNRKNFYNFKLIIPRSSGQIGISANQKNEILQKNFTYEILNHFTEDEFNEDEDT